MYCDDMELAKAEEIRNEILTKLANDPTLTYDQREQADWDIETLDIHIEKMRAIEALENQRVEQSYLNGR